VQESSVSSAHIYVSRLKAEKAATSTVPTIAAAPQKSALQKSALQKSAARA
jgi:hypothetical protein